MRILGDIVGSWLRRKRMDSRHPEGFTLIELLVVIVIIGILAAIAIPVFLDQRQSAWKSSVQSDVHHAAVAVESFGASKDGSFASLPRETHRWDDSATVQSDYTIKFRVSDGNTISIEKSGDNAYTVTGKNQNVVGAGTLYIQSSSSGRATWGGSTP